MQSKGKIFEDIANLASSVTSSASHVKKEFDHMIQNKLEDILRGMDLVSREEFEVVKAMAEKARAENENLKAELKKLKK